jgi:hypothetical protein
MGHRVRFNNRLNDRRVVGAGPEFAMVTQFQNAAIAAIGRGHNHRPRLHWCAIISDQRLFELSCDWKRRWPTRSGLNYVASRLPKSQLISRISNGGGNMPAYAANLTQADMDALVAFLETRKIQHR